MAWEKAAATACRDASAEWGDTTTACRDAPGDFGGGVASCRDFTGTELLFGLSMLNDILLPSGTVGTAHGWIVGDGEPCRG